MSMILSVGVYRSRGAMEDGCKDDEKSQSLPGIVVEADVEELVDRGTLESGSREREGGERRVQATTMELARDRDTRALWQQLHCMCVTTGGLRMQP